jgi:hypothetical protein
LAEEYRAGWPNTQGPYHIKEIFKKDKENSTEIW